MPIKCAILLLVCLFCLNKLQSQKIFYYNFGYSATIGVTGSFYKSMGIKYKSLSKCQQYVGICVPVLINYEWFLGLEYNLIYKPKRISFLYLNSEIKLVLGKMAYKNFATVTTFENYTNPFGIIFTENLIIKVKSLYLKLGPGIKYTTNLNHSFINLTQLNLALGFYFSFNSKSNIKLI